MPIVVEVVAAAAAAAGDEPLCLGGRRWSPTQSHKPAVVAAAAERRGELRTVGSVSDGQPGQSLWESAADVHQTRTSHGNPKSARKEEG